MSELAEQDIPVEYIKVGKVKKEAALDKALDKAVKNARTGKAAKQSITIKALPTTAQFTSTGKKKPPIERIDLSQVKEIRRSSLNGKVVVAALSEDKRTPYRLVAMRFKSPEAFENGIKALRPETPTARSALPSPMQGGDLKRQESNFSNVREESRPASQQVSPERSSKDYYDTTTGNGKKIPESARVVSNSLTNHSSLALTLRANPLGGNYRRSKSTKSTHNEDTRWLSEVNVGHTKTTYTSTDLIFRPSVELPTEEMRPPVPRNYAITYVASHPTPCFPEAYTPDSLLASTTDTPSSLSEQQHMESSLLGNGFTIASHSRQHTDMRDVRHLQKKRQFTSYNDSLHHKWSVESCGSHKRSQELSNPIHDAEYSRKGWRRIPPDKASSVRVQRATSLSSSRDVSDEPRGGYRIIYPSRTSANSIRRSRSHSRRPPVHCIELVDEKDVGESGVASNYTCKSEGRKNCKSSRRRWIKQPISSFCSTCGSSVWQCRPRSGSFVSDSSSMNSFEYMEADCPRGIIKLYYRPSQSVQQMLV